jgi:hypothetical protein
MRCSVAVKLVGQISSLTSKAYDAAGGRASRLPQTKPDQGYYWWAILDLNQSTGLAAFLGPTCGNVS